MSKVTVHPDALKAAQNSCGLGPINDFNFTGALGTGIQWYIDHPQITGEQVSQLRVQVSSADDNRTFINKFLTLALSGKPGVPQELRDKFPNWDTMNHDRQNELLVAYNLGKGAKS